MEVIAGVDSAAGVTCGKVAADEAAADEAPAATEALADGVLLVDEALADDNPASCDEAARSFHGSLLWDCRDEDVRFCANCLNDSCPLTLLRADLLAPGEKVHIPPLLRLSDLMNSLLVLRA